MNHYPWNIIGMRNEMDNCERKCRFCVKDVLGRCDTLSFFFILFLLCFGRSRKFWASRAQWKSDSWYRAMQLCISGGAAAG